MIDLRQLVLVILFAVAGGVAAAFAARGYRLVRRIRRDPTSRVVDLVTGPAELAGTLSSRAPLTALDREPAVALRRRVAYRYTDKDGETIHGDPFVIGACADVELEDASGRCVLALDRVVIVGPSKRYELTGAELLARDPGLHGAIVARDAGMTLERATVDESAVAEGARGFVSGTAAVDETPAAGAYREGARHVRLHGDDRRPVLLSAFDEAAVLRMLVAPLRTLAVIAALAWGCAALAVIETVVYAGRLGL